MRRARDFVFSFLIFILSLFALQMRLLSSHIYFCVALPRALVVAADVGNH